MKALGDVRQLVPHDFSTKWQLSFIVVLGATIRIVYFVGIQLADDLFYIKYVHDLLTDGFRLPANHWESRVGLVFPVYLFSRVFGFNEYVFAVFPFICSLINIVLIYKISEMLFNPRVAVLSALLLSVFPLEIYFSTSVYPTVPLATMTGFSVYLLLKSTTTKKLSYAFWSGLSLGLAYLVHTTGLLVSLFLIPYVLILGRERRMRKFFLLSAGLFLIIGAELTAYAVLAKNPLHGIVNVTRSFELNPSAAGSDSMGSTRADQRDDAFLKDRKAAIQRGGNFWTEPLWTLTTQQEFGFYYYLVIPATIYFLVKRRAVTGIEVALLWLIPVIVYLFYGTVSPFEYRPLRRWPRYFSTVTFPGIIVLSVALWQVMKSGKKVIATLIILFLISTSVAVIAVDNWHRYAYVQRAVGDYMKAHDGVYFAKGTYWHIAPFVRYDPNVLKRFDEEALKGAGTRNVRYVIFGERDRKGMSFPIVEVVETPKTLFVRLAEKTGVPNSIVQRLWRKETYYIARVS